MEVGDVYGPSSWVDMPQQRIDAFAEATNDHQWIHVDPEKAKDGPFGSTIAHGYLTLSLLPAASYEVVPRQGGSMSINYGLNKVRFVSPVPSGSRVRARIAVASVEPVRDAVQVAWAITVERDGADKPACVAEWIVRYYPEAPVP